MYEPAPNVIVAGVGKDAPLVINEQGGGQSKALYRFDLLDPKAMFQMTQELAYGAEKYGVDNWRLIGIRDHLNHMIIHAYAYLAGDTSDDHLSHIMCRAMFAQGVELQTEDDVDRVLKAREIEARKTGGGERGNEEEQKQTDLQKANGSPGEGEDCEGPAGGLPRGVGSEVSYGGFPNRWTT